MKIALLNSVTEFRGLFIFLFPSLKLFHPKITLGWFSISSTIVCLPRHCLGQSKIAYFLIPILLCFKSLHLYANDEYSMVFFSISIVGCVRILFKKSAYVCVYKQFKKINCKHPAKARNRLEIISRISQPTKKKKRPTKTIG